MMEELLVFTDINDFLLFFLALFGIFIPGILIKDKFENVLKESARKLKFSSLKIDSQSLKSTVEWIKIIAGGLFIFGVSLILSYFVVQVYSLIGIRFQIDWSVLLSVNMGFVYVLVIFLKCKSDKKWVIAPYIFSIVASIGLIVYLNIGLPTSNVTLFPNEKILNETEFNLYVMNYGDNPLLLIRFESYCKSKNCTSVSLLNESFPIMIPPRSITKIMVEVGPAEESDLFLIADRYWRVGSIHVIPFNN